MIITSLPTIFFLWSILPHAVIKVQQLQVNLTFNRKGFLFYSVREKLKREMLKGMAAKVISAPLLAWLLAYTYLTLTSFFGNGTRAAMSVCYKCNLQLK
jgi:hypothetical protein